jgi:8-oxo-dGTP pyrophosphatase MutT (NUDIX family)
VFSIGPILRIELSSIQSMIDAPTVAALIRTFDDPEDGCAMKSRELTIGLLEGAVGPFSRKQFMPGHITCTGLVLAPDRRRLLLVHHRRLDRWLLPGGHVSGADAYIWDAARREVIEETGVLLAANGIPPLVSVDVHGIPGRKSEPFHLHHDLVFRFRAMTDNLTVSAESRDVAWCVPSEFGHYDLPDSVRRAYARVMG